MGGRFCSQSGVLFHRPASQIEFRGLSPTHDSLPEGNVKLGVYLSLRIASVLYGSVFQLIVSSLLICYFRIWCLLAQWDFVLLMKIMNCITLLTEAGNICLRWSQGSWSSYWAVREVAWQEAFCLLERDWPLTTSWLHGRDWGWQGCPCCMRSPLKQLGDPPTTQGSQAMNCLHSGAQRQRKGLNYKESRLTCGKSFCHWPTLWCSAKCSLSPQFPLFLFSSPEELEQCAFSQCLLTKEGKPYYSKILQSCLC